MTEIRKNAKEIKVTVEIIWDNGETHCSVFDMVPYDFHIEETRDIIPIYDCSDFGNIAEYIENPANRGADLTIQGKIKKQEKIK